ncbi:MAG: hypothetical protein ABSD03_17655 [Vulcanimicrobiaceae bacterium]|jgi:Mn-dependent DtxR family transcriptional regulator
MTAREIAARIGSDDVTVRETLASLQAKGIVAVEGADYVLTSAGVRALKGNAPRWRRAPSWALAIAAAIALVAFALYVGRPL